MADTEFESLATIEASLTSTLAGVQQRLAQGAENESLTEALSQARVLVKYLLFDVEATHRENAYLRKMIEGKGDETSG